jgi:hypothetical protein
VRFGWGHFEGHRVAVNIDAPWLRDLGDVEEVVFGVQRYSPLDAEEGVPPRFDFVEAAIPASEASSYPGRIGYHANGHEWIGVARMVGIEDQWQRFEVVETLRGSAVDTFVFHFKEYDGVPVPSPSDTEYLIAANREETVNAEYMRVYDFRVATEEARTLLVEGLSDPPVPMNAGMSGDFGTTYRAGWDFALSNHVVATEVSGLATECFTGAGGTFVAYDVVERYRGGDEVTGIALGFPGEYLDWPCGTGYLFGFDAIEQVTPSEIAEGFTCDSHGGLCNPGGAFSIATVGILATDDRTAYVQAALKSAGPLYRLYNLDETVDPSSFPSDDDIKIWSLPLGIMDAVAAAQDMVLIQIEDVIEHEGWTEVRIATDLRRTMNHPNGPFHLKLALPCGDARLLELGSEWLAGLIDPDWSYSNEDRVIPQGELFLVPGLLVPPYFGRMGQRF